MPSEWCKYPDRLETLAKHLEKVELHRFNMSYWKIDRLGKCGTQACAMGHACSIPEFQKLGLNLVPGGTAYNGARVYNIFLGSPDDDSSPVGFAAAKELFGIDGDSAEALFGDCTDDKTPTRMAERIRVFLKDGPRGLISRDEEYKIARAEHEG